MTTIKIAIIGAGPAGCTTARILSQSSLLFDITVFEGEASVNARPQGGTLDLHTTTGIAALRRADLVDDFLKYARFDGESMQLTDKHLRRYINMGKSEESNSRGRPEIDRARLREILVDSLPPNMIKWNHHLREVDQDLTLHFDHATYTGFDLLIGADGAWSKVRPLVSDVKPFFSGVGGIWSGIRNAATAQPDIHALVNRGSVFAYSDHKSYMMQQLGTGDINVTTWSQKKEGWEHLDFPTSDADALKAYVLREYESWDSRLTQGMRVANAPTSVMDLYMLPVGHSWPHRPGVTLIGDSSHLMTPFAGEGVNLALTDAMKLADALIAANKSIFASIEDKKAKRAILSKHVELFERDMFVRAAEVQQLTFDSMTLMFFTPNAPDSVIETWLYEHSREHLPGLLAPALKPLIWTYYFLFRLLGWGIC